MSTNITKHSKINIVLCGHSIQNRERNLYKREGMGKLYITLKDY